MSIENIDFDFVSTLSYRTWSLPYVKVEKNNNYKD